LVLAAHLGHATQKVWKAIAKDGRALAHADPELKKDKEAGIPQKTEPLLALGFVMPFPHLGGTQLLKNMCSCMYSCRGIAPEFQLAQGTPQINITCRHMGKLE